MNVDKLIGSITPVAQSALGAVRKIVPNAVDTVTELSSKNTFGESLVKKRVFGLFDLDSVLPFAKKQMSSFEEISPDKLLLVHLTDYLPESGKIRTLFDMTGKPRNTLHFTLNHAVVNPLGAGGEKGWTQAKYVIFTPFDKVASSKSLIGGKYNDFMFEGKFSLPEGSFIYKQNPDIPKGKVLFKDASELLGGTKGITLVESSESAYEMGDLLPEKIGYTNLKKLHCDGTGTNMEAINMMNDVASMAKLSERLMSDDITPEEINKMFNIDIEAAIQNIDKTMEFEEQWGKTWAEFTKKLGCADVMHCDTDYCSLEKVFELLDMLSFKEAKWTYNGTDCKDVLLKVIDDITQGSGKKPDFVDMEKLKDIISSAATPKQAVSGIKTSLGIADFCDDGLKIDDTTFLETVKSLISSLTSRGDNYSLKWNY